MVDAKLKSVSEVDLRARRAATPVREFILKVAARCNLSCTYCYEYHHGDESWRLASKFMSPEVCDAAASRIAEHIRAHELKEVTVALHGGEPLLLGPKRLAKIAETLQDRISATGAELVITMQTNCILMSEDVADVVQKYNINVGVSIDGDKDGNDLNRIDHRGRGSYERVLRGINMLRDRVPGEPNGILAVIDIRNDPLKTFDAIANLQVRNIDFLLPHHNWDRLPPRDALASVAAYGDWLSVVWDAWIGGRHKEHRIRFFDNIVARLVGHPGLYESMTESPVALITINTDGDIEGVDTLKSTGSGVQRTGLSILHCEVDAVLTHELYLARQDWQLALPSACEGCSINRICTGGYMPHRYRAATGFDNPSVYCEDIKHVVSRIEKTIVGLTASVS